MYNWLTLITKQAFCYKSKKYLSSTSIGNKQKFISQLQGHLLKMHGLRKNLFRTKKLKYKALLLLEMDKAIIKEGGVEELNTEALRNACTIRGLNSRNLSNQNMIEWLNKWMEVSKTIDKNSYSLLLHCPIFFAYNHPQNWILIY